MFVTECYSAATLHFYWNQDNNVIYSVPLIQLTTKNTPGKQTYRVC